MVIDITPQDLKNKITSGEDFFLLDVREEDEREVANIGGAFIPMGEVLANHQQIPTNKPVVIYCRKGVRSAIVIQRLQDKYGLSNLLNLKGGLVAWQASGLTID